MRIPLVILALLAAAPLEAQPALDDSAAVRALREVEDACRRDARRTWGVSVCGPTLVVDARTRAFVAARLGTGAPPERGRYPDTLNVANMGVTWRGERWAMILAPLPADAYERVKLLAHESFHRVQDSLGLPQPDVVVTHLEERDGRYWLRLELRALAAALRASGAARDGRVRDALLFRAERRRRFAGADTLEDRLERHEGLASYTGARLAALATGLGPAREAQWLDTAEARGGFARAVAYATGPALGLLLDAYDPDWRARRPLPASLSEALRRAARQARPDATKLAAMARARAAAYGGAALAREEDARDSTRRARLALLRARLVEGPVLAIALGDAGVDMSFDPGAVTPLADAGTVYGSGTFRGAWGVLVVEREAEAGALVDGGFRTLVVPAPADTAARPVAGAGWRLELAPGWTLRPGARAGDLAVARAP